MKSGRVCAVIVTFNPPGDTWHNIAAVGRQVDRVVLVDNGSPEITLAALRSFAATANCVLIENGENLGIAVALNVGLRWALHNRYDWVALFDQDSTVGDGMIDLMVESHSSSAESAHIAIVTPKHIERLSGDWMMPYLAQDGSPLTVVTSGSLLPTEVIHECGLFEEPLFIDCVDDEFCLRARARGFTISLCEEAVLYHRLGEPTLHSLFGRRSIRTFNYSAERRYYMARNRVVMCRRYWSRHFGWCVKQLISLGKDAVKIALVETNRRRKLDLLARGVVDGVCGRLGAVVHI